MKGWIVASWLRLLGVATVAVAGAVLAATFDVAACHRFRRTARGIGAVGHQHRTSLIGATFGISHRADAIAGDCETNRVAICFSIIGWVCGKFDFGVAAK